MLNLANQATESGINLRAYAYNEFSVNANNYAYYQLLNSDFEGAEKSARRGLELNPNNVLLYTKLAPALLFQGKYEAAQKEFERVKTKHSYSDNGNNINRIIGYFKLYEEEKVIPAVHRQQMEKIKIYLLEKTVKKEIN